MDKFTPKMLSYSNHSSNEISIEEIMDIFLQISIALLMVFIMAYILFSSQIKAELQEAKATAKKYKGEKEAIEDTPPAQMHARLKESIIMLQKQKLIKALELVEAQDRRRLGLLRFSRSIAGSKVEYAVSGIFNGDKIVESSLIKEPFIQGSKLAKEKLAYKGSLEQEWLQRVLIIAGDMRLAKRHEKPLVTKRQDIVTKENQAWLYGEIRNRISGVYIDTCNMQGAVLAYLQNYYCENPALIKGSRKAKEIRELLEEYTSTPVEKRKSIETQLGKSLIVYTRGILEDQGVVLLSNIF